MTHLAEYTSIELLKSFGADYDEVKEEIQYEIRRWFECVDFEFIIEKLEDRGTISEEALNESKVWDEIWEMIEEEVANIFFKK